MTMWGKDLRYEALFHHFGLLFCSLDTNMSILRLQSRWLDQAAMIFRWFADSMENSNRYKPTGDWNGWFRCYTNPILSYRMDDNCHRNCVYSNQCLQLPCKPEGSRRIASFWLIEFGRKICDFAHILTETIFDDIFIICLEAKHRFG